MKEIENKTLSVRVVIKDTISQGDLERFDVAMEGEPKGTPSQLISANVRSAITAGWILEPAWTVDQVVDMDPRVVRFVGSIISKTWLELTNIPPN